MRTASLCSATGTDSQQPPRAVQAGGTWPLPVSQFAWRGADSSCSPVRSSLCISRRRPRRAQRPPVLAPWRRVRAARVLARSSRRQGCPARTHCPGEAGSVCGWRCQGMREGRLRLFVREGGPDMPRRDLGWRAWTPKRGEATGIRCGYGEPSRVALPPLGLWFER